MYQRRKSLEFEFGRSSCSWDEVSKFDGSGSNIVTNHEDLFAPVRRARSAMTHNKPDGANRRQPLGFREFVGESGVLAFTAAVAHPLRSAEKA